MPAAGQYFVMAREADAERSAQGCTWIEVGGAAAHARWAARRARHHPEGRDGPGWAPGTQQALLAAQRQLILCSRSGCFALVHLQTARQQARAGGRLSLAAGDGCASRRCTLGHVRPRRFAESQRRMASELLNGKRVLLLPPTTIAPRSSMWAVPPTLAAAIADATLAKRTPPASA